MPGWVTAETASGQGTQGQQQQGQGHAQQAGTGGASHGGTGQGYPTGTSNSSADTTQSQNSAAPSASNNALNSSVAQNRTVQQLNPGSSAWTAASLGTGIGEMPNSSQGGGGGNQLNAYGAIGDQLNRPASAPQTNLAAGGRSLKFMPPIVVESGQPAPAGQPTRAVSASNLAPSSSNTSGSGAGDAMQTAASQAMTQRSASGSQLPTSRPSPLGQAMSPTTHAAILAKAQVRASFDASTARASAPPQSNPAAGTSTTSTPVRATTITPQTQSSGQVPDVYAVGSFNPPAPQSYIPRPFPEPTFAGTSTAPIDLSVSPAMIPEAGPAVNQRPLSPSPEPQPNPAAVALIDSSPFNLHPPARTNAQFGQPSAHMAGQGQGMVSAYYGNPNPTLGSTGPQAGTSNHRPSNSQQLLIYNNAAASSSANSSAPQLARSDSARRQSGPAPHTAPVQNNYGPAAGQMQLQQLQHAFGMQQQQLQIQQQQQVQAQQQQAAAGQSVHSAQQGLQYQQQQQQQQQPAIGQAYNVPPAQNRQNTVNHPYMLAPVAAQQQPQAAAAGGANALAVAGGNRPPHASAIPIQLGGNPAGWAEQSLMEMAQIESHHAQVQWNAHQSHINNIVTSARAQFQQYEDKVANLRAHRNRLGEENKVLKKEHESLQQAWGKGAKAYDEKLSQIQTLQARIGCLESLIQNLQTETATLKAENERLTATDNEISEKWRVHYASLPRGDDTKVLTDRLSRQSKKMVELQGAKDADELTIRNLQSEVEGAKAETKSEKASAEEARARTKKLEEEVAMLQTQLRAARLVQAVDGDVKPTGLEDIDNLAKGAVEKELAVVIIERDTALKDRADAIRTMALRSSERDTAKAEAEILRNQVADGKKGLESAQKAATTLQAQRNQLSTELESVRKTLADAEAGRKSQAAEMAKLTNAVRSLHAGKKAAEEDLKNLKLLFNTFVLRLRTQLGDNTTLPDSPTTDQFVEIIQGVEKAVQEKIDAAEARAAELKEEEEKVMMLEVQLEERRECASGLEEEVKGLRKELEERIKEVEGGKKELEDLKKELEVARTGEQTQSLLTQSLQGELDKEKERVKSLKVEEKAGAEKIVQLGKEVRVEKGRVDKAEAKLKAGTEKVEELSKEVKSEKARGEKAEAEAKTATDKAHQLSKEVTSQKGRMEKAEAELKAAEAKIQTLSDQLDLAEASREASTDQSDAWAKERTSLLLQIDQLREEVELLRREKEGRRRSRPPPSESREHERHSSPSAEMPTGPLTPDSAAFGEDEPTTPVVRTHTVPSTSPRSFAPFPAYKPYQPTCSPTGSTRSVSRALSSTSESGHLAVDGQPTVGLGISTSPLLPPTAEGARAGPLSISIPTSAKPPAPARDFVPEPPAVSSILALRGAVPSSSSKPSPTSATGPSAKTHASQSSSNPARSAGQGRSGQTPEVVIRGGSLRPGSAATSRGPSPSAGTSRNTPIDFTEDSSPIRPPPSRSEPQPGRSRCTTPTPSNKRAASPSSPDGRRESDMELSPPLVNTGKRRKRLNNQPERQKVPNVPFPVVGQPIIPPTGVSNHYCPRPRVKPPQPLIGAATGAPPGSLGMDVSREWVRSEMGNLTCRAKDGVSTICKLCLSENPREGAVLRDQEPINSHNPEKVLEHVMSHSRTLQQYWLKRQGQAK